MSCRSQDDDRDDIFFEQEYDRFIAAVEEFILEESPDRFAPTDHPSEMLDDEEWGEWCEQYRHECGEPSSPDPDSVAEKKQMGLDR